VSGLVVGKAAFTVAGGGIPVSVSTRSGVMKQGTPTVDTTGKTSRHAMRITADTISGIFARYGFWTWMRDPLAAGGTLLLDAALELPDGSVTRLTFSGSNTLSYSPDGVALPTFDTDVIAGASATRDQVVYVRTWLRAASGTIGYGRSWYSDTADLQWDQAGDHVMDSVASTPTAPGPEYTNNEYPSPVELLSVHRTQSDGVSFFTWGDSNMENSDQFSYHERAMNKRWPYLRCCSAGQALASGNVSNVIALARGYSHADLAMGTNNLGSNIATNKPLLQTAIANFRAAGIGRILLCTVPPSSISSDNWTTAVNQTPFDGDPAQFQNFRDFNDAIRAYEYDCDFVYDAASYVEVDASNIFTKNGGRWRVNGGAGLGSGPHYNDAGMAAATVGMTAALTRFVTNGETGGTQTNPAMGT
jgi:hypothetical protein